MRFALAAAGFVYVKMLILNVFQVLAQRSNRSKNRLVCTKLLREWFYWLAQTKQTKPNRSIYIYSLFPLCYTVLCFCLFFPFSPDSCNWIAWASRIIFIVFLISSQVEIVFFIMSSHLCFSLRFCPCLCNNFFWEFTTCLSPFGSDASTAAVAAHSSTAKFFCKTYALDTKRTKASLWMDRLDKRRLNLKRTFNVKSILFVKKMHWSPQRVKSMIDYIIGRIL